MTANPNAIQPYQKLKQLISADDVRARFMDILGEKRAGAFLASVLNTVYLSDALKTCDPNTIITAAITAAALDLPVDPNLGFSWIIPYKGKATFQMGYRGYIQLAMRTGQYTDLNVTEVYQGERVRVDRLTGRIVLNGQRSGDAVTGYVAYLRLLNGFEKYYYMSVEEVEAHKIKYAKGYDRPDSAWKTNFDGMAKKTVLKALLSKYGLMSVQMQGVIAKDIEPYDPAGEAEERGDGQVIDHQPSFDAAALLVEIGVSENEHAAAGLLRHAPDEIKQNAETLTKWGKIYRGWRDVNPKMPAAEAAAHATNGEVPDSNGRVTEQAALL